MNLQKYLQGKTNMSEMSIDVLRNKVLEMYEKLKISDKTKQAIYDEIMETFDIGKMELLSILQEAQPEEI